jgi:hypothetical protein
MDDALFLQNCTEGGFAQTNLRAKANSISSFFSILLKAYF